MQYKEKVKQTKLSKKRDNCWFVFWSLQWVHAFVFNHRPSGRETQRVRVAVQSRRFLPMPLPLLCQSRSRRRPRWPGLSMGLDQGGLDRAGDLWTVDTAKALFWKKKTVDHTWPSTRESSVNFGPGAFGFLAKCAKFAESETSYWLKSVKALGL